MANSVANVVAGRPLSTGGVFTAPLATALPTDAVTALNVAFTSPGYIGDSGVTETVGRETTKVKAWGGDTVKVLQTDYSVTYQYTMIESLNAATNKEVYGDGNVTTTAASSAHGTQLAIALNSGTLPHKERVLEIKDGIAKVRIVLPDSQIIAVGDVTYSDDSVIAYPVTVQAFPDASGNSAYKYTDDGVTTA